MYTMIDFSKFCCDARFLLCNVASNGRLILHIRLIFDLVILLPFKSSKIPKFS